MSHITRCPFCATTFKVVADQLRISDGWVRCGQCKEVFDASQHLQAPEPVPLLPDMPLDALRAPPVPVARGQEPAQRAWAAGAAAPKPPAPSVPEPVRAPEPVPAPVPASPASAAWNVPQSPVPPFLLAGEMPEPAMPSGAQLHDNMAELSQSLEHAVLSQSAVQEVAWPLESAADAEPGHAWADISPLSVAVDAPAVPEPASPSAQKALAPQPQPAWEDSQEGADMPPLAEPGFVKLARRNAFWRRPVVRGTLVLVGLLLACALGLQVAVQERDVIAARYPAARPLLERLCEPLGCALQAPRQISALVIDSSSFLKMPRDAAAYQLQMSLKNTSGMAVAMPALELTLTDAQGEPVLRRVLLRTDVAAPETLAPGAVWSGSAAVRVASGAAAVAGYRLLAFYP